ncbi:hypothetical protein OIE13_22360 [Streptosporangium sp. NBC_01810]|uniref:VG15 protein n=1 Tax=Streptosporangium sp. NBC_01810 TaxID=2975951 RepID=UPI002DD7C0C9|nr:hypothetical protein [Streptosporangium sp. NBC_01810]WSA23687.1 hypothetical protein OIE13_22360 [Streptosporangium sp. NBC_01810]
MSVEQIAADHYQAQQTIARQAVEQAQTLWSEVEPAAVVDSWVGQLAAMLRVLILGQTTAAALSQPYVEALAVQQGIPPVGGVNPAAFAGVAADGRALTSLLMQPALRTLGLLATGADDQSALLSGLASLTRIVDTEISDASRAADQVGMVANRGWVTYVRHVSLPACGRCIILAGREYSWSTGFLRHERCDCTMVPRRAGDERPPAPEELFAQMTPEEQAKAFTVGGAEAIRLGADLGQVVNARRGMQTVGGRLVTTEGTSRRGVAGRKMGSTSKRKSAVRPMPEQLIADAGGDRDEAIRRLRQFGYLDGASTRRTAAARDRVTQAPEPVAQQASQAAPERVAADAPNAPRVATPRPSISDLIPNSYREAANREDDIKAAIPAQVNGSYAGLDVNVFRVFPLNNKVEVWGAVHGPDGTEVGEFLRVFHRDYDGAIFVEHAKLELDSSVQGQGFAREFNAAMESWYVESGVERIELHANIDVGGYAWSRSGYDFADADSAEAIIEALDTTVWSSKEDLWELQAQEFDTPGDSELAASITRLNSEIEAAEEIVERGRTLEFGDDNFPTALEIGQVGRTPGADSWIGKRTMLDTEWAGVKWLR